MQLHTDWRLTACCMIDCWRDLTGWLRSSCDMFPSSSGEIDNESRCHEANQRDRYPCPPAQFILNTLFGGLLRMIPLEGAHSSLPMPAVALSKRLGALRFENVQYLALTGSLKFSFETKSRSVRARRNFMRAPFWASSSDIPPRRNGSTSGSLPILNR